MGKGKGQFKYVENRRISNKPVKSTRLRKSIPKSEDKTKFLSKCLGIAIYIVSFLCLIMACIVLGAF